MRRWVIARGFILLKEIEDGQFGNRQSCDDNAGFFNSSLAQTDPEVAGAINDELKRQQDQIEMIASENIVSTSVMEAQGSILTNKYAEGYSGRRYYGGCEHVDVIETLAIERAKKLFNCNFVNVQPHSGAQANQAVFFKFAETWRYNSRDVIGGWWSSNPWGRAEPFREMV